tara:strand:+ start:38 stop:1069 length:1032 start_codon:yes stop_codon:yes gene_type:complete
MKHSKNIIGLTLLEILIGIIITTIMMAAMYTSYNVVNKSYSQVSGKAKISRSSRDLVSMLMRDIRMAGFRYYVGSEQIKKFARDTSGPACTNGVVLPKFSYLFYDSGFDDPAKSHNPIVIRRNTPGPGTGLSTRDLTDCCDQIQIVYEDFDQNDYNEPFKRYRITYYANPVDESDLSQGYSVYKRVENFSDPRPDGQCTFFNEAPPTEDGGEGNDGDGGDNAQTTISYSGSWTTTCPECTPNDVLVRKHIEMMEFIPFDENGKVIKSSSNNYPTPEDPNTRSRLYDIRGVDVRLTFRTKEEFFRDPIPRTEIGLSGRDKTHSDRYLRDSVIVTVATRNIGESY